MMERDSSILILAPAGRDAAVATSILEEIGVPCVVCGGLDELVSLLERACCVVVTEDALRQCDRRALAAWVEGQPPWSDFPFILLTFGGQAPDSRLMATLGNVTIIERPFHPATLVNAVRSAIRARKRQREAEAHLEERHRTAERQGLLIRELHHRVKNTLATVQALLGATARSTESIEEFYHSFSARVVSLGKTHMLLTEDYWQTASLQELLANELSPYEDDNKSRILLTGPAIELTADLAVPTGMAIHELATNAAKYGSLSVPDGSLEVNWDVKQVESARKLHLNWIERGGPPVEKPSRTGFGSTLLQRVLATQCRAEIRYEFERSGLRFQMEAPLVQRRLVPPY